MTFQNFLLGVAAILFGIVLWAIAFAIFKGLIAVCKSLIKKCWAGAKLLVRNPKEAIIESPFLIQILILPFLLVFEQIYKRLYPQKYTAKLEAYRNKTSHQKMVDAINQRLDTVALYREDNTICLIKISEIKIDEISAHFKASICPHKGFSDLEESRNFGFGGQWQYLFVGDESWSFDSQFLKWRVNFNIDRIKHLGAYAQTLPDTLSKKERYKRLNYFFTYEKELPVENESSVNLSESSSIENDAWIDTDEMNAAANHAWEVDKLQIEAWERPWMPCIADLYDKVVNDKKFSPFDILSKVQGAEHYILSSYAYNFLEAPIIEPAINNNYKLVLPNDKDVSVIQFNGEAFYHWWRVEYQESRAKYWHSPYATIMIEVLQAGSLKGLQGVFSDAVNMRDMVMMCLWGLHVELIEDLPEMADWQSKPQKDTFNFTGKKGDTGYVMTYMPFALSSYNLANDAPVWVQAPNETRGVAIPWAKLKVAQNVSARIDLLKHIRNLKLSQTEPDNWREQ